MMETISMKGRVVFPGTVKGEAIVAKSPIPISTPSIDVETGTFRWKGHQLDGVCVKDKILVIPEALGSSGGDWALYSLNSIYDTAPRAIICSKIDIFTAAGSILGNIPTIDRLEIEPTELIETGDDIRVDSEKGLVEILVNKDRAIKAREILEKRKNHKRPIAEKPFTLNNEEEEMIAGNLGEGVKECIEFLIKYGKTFDARHMVEIASVHPAACGYEVAGEGAIRYLEWLAQTGCKVRVPATLNPISVDLKRWKTVMRLSEEVYIKQLQLNRAFQKLGFVPSFSCSPYWTNVVPKLGEHIVWGEHNAVCYANTVFGARTNFEAHMMAFPAAITGRIPEYGLHIEANRKAQVIVKVETKLKDPLDWKCIGFYVGKRLIDKIPLFLGLPDKISNRQFRDLCSTMGPPYAKLPMFHILGVTPEAPDMKSAFKSEVHTSEETLAVGRKELREAHEMLNNTIEENIDLVMLGCPFYCIEDLKEVADLLRGNRVHPNVQLWIWTDEATRSIAERMDLVHDVEKAGGSILTDTCSVAGSLEECDYGFKNIMTDSLKASAYFLRSGKFTSSVGSMEECIEAAVAGKRRR